MPPIHLRQIERKDRAAADHTVIIARAKGLAHLPVKGSAGVALDDLDRRCRIGERLDGPTPTARPVNAQVASAGNVKVLLW